MTVQSQDIADFYHQLAMLVKADLPLPESIRQLGCSFHKRGFRPVLDQISRDTADGDSLAAALERHPEYFQPFHIQLIATGERSGALPDILFEVARVSRVSQQLLNRTRDVMVYPVFTILFTGLLFTVLLQQAVPGFQIMYADMAAEMRVPLLTRIVFALSDLTNARPQLVYGGFAVVIGLVLWMFSGRLCADRILYGLMHRCPGARRLLHEADLARTTALLATYLRRQVPVDAALAQTAELVEGAGLQRRLRRWAENIQQGRTWSELLSAPGHEADPLLALTVRNSTEGALADELDELSDLYLERAESARAKAVALWQFILVLAMTTIVVIAIFALFLPLLNLLNYIST